MKNLVIAVLVAICSMMVGCGKPQTNIETMVDSHQNLQDNLGYFLDFADVQVGHTKGDALYFTEEYAELLATIKAANKMFDSRGNDAYYMRSELEDLYSALFKFQTAVRDFDGDDDYYTIDDAWRRLDLRTSTLTDQVLKCQILAPTEKL